jgi:hypothetical protein
MGASETAVALRSAISNYVQATVENALDVRAGLAELHGTEKRMLDTGAALDAAIDATALTLAADMVEGLRQIRNMIDAPHFGEARKWPHPQHSFRSRRPSGSGQSSASRVMV